jgi:biopolymer transport protein ExbD
MSRSRSIRNNKRRGKREVLEIDITSLLDILVILLVFLLKSYNSSGVILTVPEGITLPNSESQSLNTAGVIIQVSPEKIWVDSKTILDKEDLPRRLYDEGKRRIIPLYNELVRKRDEIKTLHKQTPQAAKFSGIANLVVDKSLKYSYVKKIMYTCAAAGFKQYKFVVMGENQ